MTRRSILRAGLTAASLSVQLPGDDSEAGFTSMFNGRNLEGWSIREGPESAFYVDGNEIVIHPGSNFPTWLRYDRALENFDFRCEFFMRGWSNSGIYLHAPEHGRNTWAGMKINLFHKKDEKPLAESIGAIFPVVAPLKISVHGDGEWNTMRALVDWPRLQVWINGELVQDLNLERTPELQYRLRSGYIGIESLSYPLRFRNLRYRALPPKEKWQTLYSGPEDLALWQAASGKPNAQALGPVLRMDGSGYLRTRDQFQDFEFQSYIRAQKEHNGGVLFRGQAPNSLDSYEIQLHDVEGAVYPTGSLYHYRRSSYPKIEPEQWFLFQLIVKGKECVVRINGENVVEYSELQRTAAAPIMLQAHRQNYWIEFKQMRVKTLP